MTKFTYRGPVSSVSLRSGTSVTFVAGRTYELPEEDPYVRTMVARGLLTRCEAAPVAPVASAVDVQPLPKSEAKASKKDLDR